MRIWHTKTQEEYDHLMKQLEAEGCKWASGEEPTHRKGLWVSVYEERTCILEDEGKLLYGSIDYCEKKHPDTEIQPVVIPEPKPSDSIRELVAQDKENKKMNKQELIEKLNILPKYSINAGKFYNIGIGFRTHDVLELVEQLDEHQKVVLPKDVAEWLEASKHMNLLELLSDLYEHYSNDETCIGKFVKEYCTSVDEAYKRIARAYLNGYEVEKEKLYTVVLPNIESSKYSRDYYLQRSEIGEVHLAKGRFEIRDNTKLTEAEIKSVDERYMAFAEEVTE